MLRVLARHYEAVTRDVVRIKSRLRAIFRARAIATGGARFFSPAGRRPFLRKLVRRPAEHLRAKALFVELDLLRRLQREARTALVARASANPAFSHLTTCPCVGPLRAALFIAYVVTPNRFRNRRRFWRYAGLAVRQRGTGEHVFEGEALRRVPKRTRTWGLDRQCNHALKALLRQTACGILVSRSPLRDIYDQAVARGLARSVARSVLARKLATILLALWRNARSFDAALLAAPVPLPPKASRGKLPASSPRKARD